MTKVAFLPTLFLLALLAVAYLWKPARAGGDGASPLPAGPVCSSRPAGTRWDPDGVSYAAAGEYGRSEDTWIGSAVDLSYSEGRAYLLDAGRARVAVLDEDLNAVDAFGRGGHGPGEISDDIDLPFLPRYWQRRFIGSAGARVALYDRREIQVHTADGDLLGQRTWPDDSQMVVYGVRLVSPIPSGGTVVVVDSVDFAGDAPRRIQVWKLEEIRADPVLIAERRLPLPVRSRTLAREARPLAAFADHCLATTDGAGPFLHLTNVVTGASDSLRMPAYEVPNLGEHADDNAVALPFATDQAPDPGDRSPIRWTDLAVDPDGFVWVKKWAPHRSRIVDVIVLDPSDGSWREVSLPAFPRAFIRPGEFLGIVEDPETDEQLVVKYVLQR